MDNAICRRAKTVTHEQDFKCAHCGDVALFHATAETPETFQIPNGPLIGFVRHTETLRGSWLVAHRMEVGGSVLVPWCPCQPHGVGMITVGEGDEAFTVTRRGKHFDFGNGQEVCNVEVYKNTEMVEESFSQDGDMPEGKHYITPPQRLNIED